MTALRNRINKLQRTVIIQTLFLCIMGSALLISLSFNLTQVYAFDSKSEDMKSVTNDITKFVTEDIASLLMVNILPEPTKTTVVNSGFFPNLLATSELVNNYLPPFNSEYTNKALNTGDEPKTVDNTSIDTPMIGAVSKVSTENNTEYQTKTVLNKNDTIVNQNTEPVIKEPVFTETQITGNAEIDIEILIKTVNEIAPALSGIEDSMIKIYNETGIKPSFQLAKFCLESGYGRSDLAQNKNNIAGWNAYPSNGKTSYQNATTFGSLDECVLTVGYGLSDNYISGGRTTIKSIANKYCPGNASKWSSDVTWLMNRIESTYNSLT